MLRTSRKPGHAGAFDADKRHADEEATPVPSAKRCFA
jgi:hypothetical protein